MKNPKSHAPIRNQTSPPPGWSLKLAAWCVVLRACVMLGAWCLVLPVLAQQYSINWFKVAGGGSMDSTGGVYHLSGTIGQQDAGGPMLGGTYSLTGGFWSLYALQTVSAPLLSIKLTTTNTALVYWPSLFTGFNLQQNNDLNTSNWVAPAETVIDNGYIKYIIVNPPVGNRYYRLKH